MGGVISVLRIFSKRALDVRFLGIMRFADSTRIEGLSDDTHRHLERFQADLKHRKIQGSSNVALQSLNLVRQISLSEKWETPGELLALLRSVALSLATALPAESVPVNIVRRAMKLAREEYQSLCKDSDSTAMPNESHTRAEECTNRHRLALGSLGDRERFSRQDSAFKPALIEALDEMETEIDGIVSNIASQALEHIHASEVILTFGMSRTVKTFLLHAARKRKFHVMVAVGAPFGLGKDLAFALAKAGVETTLITDTAVAAVMARVNKVIIGAHAVLANGGLRAALGSYNIALAAKRYAVPVIACTSLYKLTPTYPTSATDPLETCLVSPERVLSQAVGREVLAKTRVICPAFDLVPSELVTLFISNIGGNTPAYVYRLLGEQYHPEDYVFETVRRE